MKTFQTLLYREWLQNRFAWSLMALLPMAVVMLILLLPFKSIHIDIETADKAGADLPLLAGVITIAATTLITFAVQWLGSIYYVAGLARRDHADRSVEFWLSLPTSHSQSLAVPLLMHLVLVPAAGLLVGLAGGYVLSLAVVGKVTALSDWFSLPWGHILPASLALVGRLLLGLPLATLWLLPLLLLLVLAHAYFKRWGVVVLGMTYGLVSLALQYWVGTPWLQRLMDKQLNEAGRAMMSSEQGIGLRGPGDGMAALAAMPYWAASDLAQAVRALASPHLLGGLLLAAGLFALLLEWRKRSA